MCVREGVFGREYVCVCKRERGGATHPSCVPPRESVCVYTCVGDFVFERECVTERETERARMREREREMKREMESGRERKTER